MIKRALILTGTPSGPITTDARRHAILTYLIRQGWIVRHIWSPEQLQSQSDLDHFNAIFVLEHSGFNELERIVDVATLSHKGLIFHFDHVFDKKAPSLYAKELMIQAQAARLARLVSINSWPNAELLKQQHPQAHALVVVPYGCRDTGLLPTQLPDGFVVTQGKYKVGICTSERSPDSNYSFYCFIGAGIPVIIEKSTPESKLVAANDYLGLVVDDNCRIREPYVDSICNNPSKFAKSRILGFRATHRWDERIKRYIPYLMHT